MIVVRLESAISERNLGSFSSTFSLSEINLRRYNVKKINVFLPLVLYCLALLKPLDLQARSIVVACGDPTARVHTIAAGIARLPQHGPGTILVSGTCNE